MTENFRSRLTKTLTDNGFSLTQIGIVIVEFQKEIENDQIESIETVQNRLYAEIPDKKYHLPLSVAYRLGLVAGIHLRNNELLKELE